MIRQILQAVAVCLGGGSTAELALGVLFATLPAQLSNTSPLKIQTFTPITP
jgi:hypothetical protein